MPADFNEPLARSTSAGSPPAIRYRAPPMVPVIHTVMLLITVGRSATARGVGSAAYAAAAVVATVALAVMVITASRMRLRYMGAHTSRPSGWGMWRMDGRRHRRARGAGRGSLAPSQVRVGGVNTAVSAGPPPNPFGGAGNRTGPAITQGRVAGDSLPTKGSSWVPNAAPASLGAPNWHPTDPTGHLPTAAGVGRPARPSPPPAPVICAAPRHRGRPTAARGQPRSPPATALKRKKRATARVGRRPAFGWVGVWSVSDVAGRPVSAHRVTRG